MTEEERATFLPTREESEAGGPGLTIDALIRSFELAKRQLGGDVVPLVDWSVGAGESWPVLHVSHGVDENGAKYCGATIGVVREDSEGDADLESMGSALKAAGSQLLKDAKASDEL
jgi:hypothetical protein